MSASAFIKNSPQLLFYNGSWAEGPAGPRPPHQAQLGAGACQPVPGSWSALAGAGVEVPALLRQHRNSSQSEANPGAVAGGRR